MKPHFRYIVFSLLSLLFLSTAAAQSAQATGNSDRGPREKVILGSEEMVYVSALGESFNARIDTGARTSSIHARNVMPFERDGERWVRFNTDHDGTDRYAELPLESMVAVRQTNSSDPVYRPVIRLTVQIGPIHKEALFSLADRSRMTFPVLIGRNVLSGDALVDVSLSYVHGR